MAGILGLVGASLGGWIGWALGERFGIMTAFFLSLVGTAFGVWGAHRLRRHFMP